MTEEKIRALASDIIKNFDHFGMMTEPEAIACMQDKLAEALAMQCEEIAQICESGCECFHTTGIIAEKLRQKAKELRGGE